MDVLALRCFRVLRRSVLARGAVPSAVYGAHLFLVVAVTGDRAAGDGLLDAPQVLVGERYVCRSGVLLQALAAFGTGDGDYVVALVEQPGEGELSRRRALLVGDLPDL